MSNTRILHAYCKELDDVVSIDTARRYFICDETSPAAYHFFCDDEQCGHLRVRVSGVNYRTLASESKKYVAAHFRALDPHDSKCKWMLDADDDSALAGESDEDARQRRLRRKLHDFVTVFDPVIDDDSSTAGAGGRVPASADPPVGGHVRSKRKDGDEDDRAPDWQTKTNQLTRLVETYTEAKATLTREEMSQLAIRVVNEGVLRLDDYFCRLAQASGSTRNRVIHGGARLVKRYGKGFRLKFFDKVGGTDVFLYIPSEKMEAYRFRKLLEQTVACADDVKYFKVFALGRLVPGMNERNTDLLVEDLRHLAIVLGPSKSESQEAAATA